MASVDLQKAERVGLQPSWWTKKQQRLEIWENKLKAERVAKRFSPGHVLGEFMAGCSIEDLDFLLNFDQLEENIYHLNMDSQSLVIKDQDLPWPVRFVLARFNRKHIFSSGRLPCEQEVARCVNGFVQKMKWRWNIQGEERPKPIWKSSMPTPRFDGIADSALCAFLVQLERRVSIAVRRSIRASKLVVESWKNQFPLVTWSLQWMRRHGCRVIPNDKESGCTVC